MSILKTKATSFVLIVDDDEIISSLIGDSLQREGYRVVTVRFAEDALAMSAEPIDLVITEISLPGDVDGFELLRRLKTDASTSEIPIVVCSKVDSENSIVAALNSGADDYIVKPFSLREFIARARSMLRRHRNFEPIVTPCAIEYRSMLLNSENHSLIIDGESVALSPNEFSLLFRLMSSRNKLFSRQELLTDVWLDEDMKNPRVIDVNISRLGKKLGSYGQNIVNRSGIGYGFLDM